MPRKPMKHHTRTHTHTPLSLSLALCLPFFHTQQRGRRRLLIAGICKAMPRSCRALCAVIPSSHSFNSSSHVASISARPLCTPLLLMLAALMLDMRHAAASIKLHITPSSYALQEILQIFFLKKTKKHCAGGGTRVKELEFQI